MHVGMGPHKRYIYYLRHLIFIIPDHIPHNILEVHALTGCDSTNASFRISKNKALSNILQYSIDLSQLGNSASCNPELIASCEEFIAKIYGDFVNITGAQYR